VNTLKNMTFNMTTKKMGLSSLALSVLLLTTTTVIASTQLDTKILKKKVDNVLLSTEKAISTLRVNDDLSLKNINFAMDQIEKLENAYKVKVSTETDTKYNTEIAKSYEHFYPPLGETAVNIDALPNLSYKINSNILYKGSDDDLINNAYLDYTFAKASLKTAKDAIVDGDKLEAMANLKRVFEAVYIAPDFDVAKSNS